MSRMHHPDTFEKIGDFEQDPNMGCVFTQFVLSQLRVTLPELQRPRGARVEQFSNEMQSPLVVINNKQQRYVASAHYHEFKGASYVDLRRVGKAAPLMAVYSSRDDSLLVHEVYRQPEPTTKDDKSYTEPGIQTLATLLRRDQPFERGIIEVNDQQYPELVGAAEFAELGRLLIGRQISL